MENIDIYNYSISYPTRDTLQRLNRTAFLVYVTPFVSSLIEYAGRTCYKSFNHIKENSYKTFIKNIVNSGHESVIEHSNLVYVVFKPQGNKAKDSDILNRQMITLMMYNGLLSVSESQACYLISGNIRMFKDLIKKYYDIKAKNNKSNKILDDILDSFYNLPDYYFGDMITSGIMNATKFKSNPKISTATTTFDCKRLNDYVTILNHDKFYYRIKNFKTVSADGHTIIKKINVPNHILMKHNRLTLIINAPRFITHQIVRSRLASYSQQSLRYVEEDTVHVYMPESYKTNHMEALANSVFNTDFTAYKSMIEAGIMKEDARAVLPLATMSTIVMTATIEQFNHFIGLRADPAAQNFIRDMIAKPLKAYLEEYYADKAARGKAHSELVEKAMENTFGGSSAHKYHGNHNDKMRLKKRIQKKHTNKNFHHKSNHK